MRLVSSVASIRPHWALARPFRPVARSWIKRRQSLPLPFMFITRCWSTVTLYYTSICSGFVVQVVPTLLRCSWQDFDWHVARSVCDRDLIQCYPRWVSQCPQTRNRASAVSTSIQTCGIWRAVRQCSFCNNIDFGVDSLNLSFRPFPHTAANGASWPPGKMDEKLNSETCKKEHFSEWGWAVGWRQV